MPTLRTRLAVAVLAGLLGALALGSVAPALAQGATASPDKVTLQLKWLTQAQFAGYYAARARGFYAAEGLDVTIVPGGPERVSERIVAAGQAQFGIDWLPSLLAMREQGLPLVNIAQIFPSSAMREVAFKASGIRGPADLKGRKVAVWMGGNEFQLLATLDKYKIDRTRDVTLVPQPFDMTLFLQRKVDAAAITTYNEYHEVLKAGVKPEELVVIDFNKEGTAMLEDGLFVSSMWLAEGKNREVAARFLRASLGGWRLCREKPADCVGIVLDASPSLDREHQTWMMTEVNKLIWGPPVPKAPLGKMDPAAFRRTADIARRYGVITKPAGEDAYTTAVWDLAQKK